MLDGSEIESLIDSLDAQVDEAEGGSSKWKEVWNEIKTLDSLSRDTISQPPSIDRPLGSDSSQSSPGLKADQEASQRRSSIRRIRESEYHWSRLAPYVEGPRPPDSGLADVDLSLFVRVACLLSL